MFWKAAYLVVRWIISRFKRYKKLNAYFHVGKILEFGIPGKLKKQKNGKWKSVKAEQLSVYNCEIKFPLRYLLETWVTVVWFYFLLKLKIRTGCNKKFVQADFEHFIFRHLSWDIWNRFSVKLFTHSPRIFNKSMKILCIISL